jgi:hypothetical protein
MKIFEVVVVLSKFLSQNNTKSRVLKSGLITVFVIVSWFLVVGNTEVGVLVEVGTSIMLVHSHSKSILVVG